MPKIKFDRRYQWVREDYYDLQTEEIQDAHDGSECRVLRCGTHQEGYSPKRVFWVVFDDGYITVASPSELVKVSG